MLNKALLIGNLGADPETRTAGSGTVITNLRVATSRRVKEDDSYVEKTEWHRVTVFGKTAESCAKYLKKGRQVYVEGRIETQQWTDKEGVERYTTVIIADDVRFLGGGSRDADDSDDSAGF